MERCDENEDIELLMQRTSTPRSNFEYLTFETDTLAGKESTNSDSAICRDREP